MSLLPEEDVGRLASLRFLRVYLIILVNERAKVASPPNLTRSLGFVRRLCSTVTCSRDPDRPSRQLLRVRRLANSSYATSDITLQHLVYNELAFTEFTQAGLWSYTPMADSASFTGMSVPNSPCHILVYLNQTADQRQHTLQTRPPRRIRFPPPLHPAQNHP